MLVPSSTIAQGYESYLVQTNDGQIFTGIIGRQTRDLVVLLDSARNEQRIRRDQIEQMRRQVDLDHARGVRPHVDPRPVERPAGVSAELEM